MNPNITAILYNSPHGTFKVDRLETVAGWEHSNEFIRAYIGDEKLLVMKQRVQIEFNHCGRTLVKSLYDAERDGEKLEWAERAKAEQLAAMMV